MKRKLILENQSLDCKNLVVKVMDALLNVLKQLATV